MKKLYLVAAIILFVVLVIILVINKPDFEYTYNVSYIDGTSEIIISSKPVSSLGGGFGSNTYYQIGNSRITIKSVKRIELIKRINTKKDK